jgi:endonuclease G
MRKRRKQEKSGWKLPGFAKIAICFIGILLLHNCFYGNISKQAATCQSSPEIEIPGFQNGREEQIIYHEGYTVSYNTDYKIANWVAYRLTAEEVKSTEARRSDNYMPDPMVKENETATNDDYRRSGYDRGHLAPAADMKWSVTAMNESFYFTNICPQNKNLNAGIWNDLEIQCRKWAIQYSDILIIAGPVTDEYPQRLGRNRVAIPRGFFKVVYIRHDGQPKGMGFLFDNRAYINTSFKEMAVPVDSIEKVTGLDFSRLSLPHTK